MATSNQLTIEFSSLSENLSFARVAVAAFASQINFTMHELEEIKVMVSEAVSNSITHGYNNSPDEKVKINAVIQGQNFHLEIEDYGCGIEDIEQAMEPAYSTSEERMGLGFVFMQSFSEYMNIDSVPEKGTKVTLSKSAASNTEKNYVTN
ncbi:MAG: anti-sigma F factor [Clostridiales bacterium]|nr:anti-sigma F factor [Clostridiales bacterium]MCF8021212.1 anti-sigma F factor [Clostridiales bacterium]